MEGVDGEDAVARWQDKDVVMEKVVMSSNPPEKKNFTEAANNSSSHFNFSSSIGLYTLAQSGSIHYCSIRLNLLQYSY